MRRCVATEICKNIKRPPTTFEYKSCPSTHHPVPALCPVLHHPRVFPSRLRAVHGAGHLALHLLPVHGLGVGGVRGLGDQGLGDAALAVDGAALDVPAWGENVRANEFAFYSYRSFVEKLDL